MTVRRSWKIWLPRAALVGAITAVVSAVIARTPPAQTAEVWLLDLCFAWRGVRETQTKIVLVAIDEAQQACEKARELGSVPEKPHDEDAAEAPDDKR